MNTDKKDKHADGLAADTLLQILEHTYQKDTLLYLQFSETTEPPKTTKPSLGIHIPEPKDSASAYNWVDFLEYNILYRKKCRERCYNKQINESSTVEIP